MITNIYTSLEALVTEADVEQAFVRRLLEDMGYEDHEIKAKESLQQLQLGKGHKKEHYRPDFAILVNNIPRIIIEAKSPDEDLIDHTWQPASYCFAINQSFYDDNPVRIYILTNGKHTWVFNWDTKDAVLTIGFSEFDIKSKKYAQLSSLVHKDSVVKWNKVTKTPPMIELEKKPLEEVNSIFSWCHQEIYKKDNMSQSDAFVEFVKLIALKLLSDRKVKDKYPSIVNEKIIKIPVEDVDFSLAWLTKFSTASPNPINSIQFAEFIRNMEIEISQNKRKRIFDSNSQIILKSDTIRSIVSKLENVFLFGIDADLNGRLFETFLNATMRGKDLGQFFTPRTIVKLCTRLAAPSVKIQSNHIVIDKVIDACCGSGGFLIDVLDLMWKSIENNNSLSQSQRNSLKQMVANEALVGIDAGSAPNLARIARLNMYLHGDGGTKIFQTDALDYEVAIHSNDNVEMINEKNELRNLFLKPIFDLALTNPPFAKEYSKNKPGEGASFDTDEAKIVSQYFDGKFNSIKSSLMFFHRYYSILKPKGRLVTIIDDGILSGPSYLWFREWFLGHFIVKGIISLPGDAFQRSNARVKTSILIAEKREVDDVSDNPSVFMYGCMYVGLDDPSRARALPSDQKTKKLATEEVEKVVSLYNSFLDGKCPSEYIVDGKLLSKRMDVKNLLIKRQRLVDYWESMSFKLFNLDEMLHEKNFEDAEIIVTDGNTEFVRYLTVQYNGYAVSGEEKIASETSYSKLYKVNENNIVISNIAASYGSIAVVPKELDGYVVSNEYTVLVVKDNFEARIVWSILRSPEVLSEILLSATGISRNRIKWSDIKKIKVPYPNKELASELLNTIREAEQAEMLARNLRKDAVLKLENHFNLNNVIAANILKAFKPPK